ncbi:hypothetical protein A4X13_0g6101, partial [Tilletia indica]
MSSAVSESRPLPKLPAEILRSIFVHAARDIRPKTRYAQHPDLYSSPPSTTSNSLSFDASDRCLRRRRRASSTSKNTIASLLSVSKAVQHWVLAELLHSVALTSPSHINAFGALLKRRPDLGQFVRRIWISDVSMSSLPSSGEMIYDIHRLFALEGFILPNLPHLEDLAMSNLADHQTLRTYGHSLWYIGRTRTSQAWANLRSITLANMNGMGVFLQNPTGVPQQADRITGEHPICWERLEHIRVALPEELSAYRINGLARCPRLKVVEFFEPGFDTLLNVDVHMGSMVAAGMDKQKFSCIRGHQPSQEAIKCLFTALMRPTLDDGYLEGAHSLERTPAGIQLRIHTRSPDAYESLQQIWEQLRTEIQDHDSKCPRGFDFRLRSETEHAPHEAQTLGFLTPAPQRLPSLHLIDIAPGESGPENGDTYTTPQDRQEAERVAQSGEPAENEDGAVPADQAAEWKSDLNDAVFAHWDNSNFRPGANCQKLRPHYK